MWFVALEVQGMRKNQEKKKCMVMTNLDQNGNRKFYNMNLNENFLDRFKNFKYFRSTVVSDRNKDIEVTKEIQTEKNN